MALSFLKGAITSKAQLRTRLFLAELLPVLFALPFVFAFFVVTVPDAMEHWKQYAILSAILVAVTRIPNEIVKNRWVLPSVFRWLKLREDGRQASQAELGKIYCDMTRIVPRLQAWAVVLWFGAAVTMLVAARLWLDLSALGVLTLSFSALIVTVLSLGFSYFTFLWLSRPLIEEVRKSLDELPDRGVFRIGLRAKLGGSLFIFTALALVVFGILIWVKARSAFEGYALAVHNDAAVALAKRLSDAPPTERGALLKGASDATKSFILVDANGEIEGSAEATGFGPQLKEAVARAKASASFMNFHSRQGAMRVYPLAGGTGFLVLRVNPSELSATLSPLIWTTAIFLVVILFLVGLFILALTREMTHAVGETARYNKRLAQGDLTEMPTAWSDDELGEMTDHMRVTFRSLARLAREIKMASGAVSDEAGRLVTTSQTLFSTVSEQSAMAEETDGYARQAQESMALVSDAMRQVASSTQDVSATVLQMQASVEEIAATAEVLASSAENTVSSTNEIAVTAEQVRASASQLHQSGQEAVSFLTELDASLAETGQGAAGLSKLATRVTEFAEGGFGSVAAVEEEIIRTLRVSEESRKALEDLRSSIESIGRIVDVIQDITEQTNLLSLNASIIAAGAGEHGKAFGVVASQVRELSQKTKVRAREIREVIRSVQRGGGEIAEAMERVFSMVKRSSELSRTAGDSLKTILESASSQEEMTKRIAAAAEELAHGGQSASKTMHQIFDMIESISRSVSEQAETTGMLTREAQKVRDVVLQLRHATKEQASGAQMISGAVANITRDSQTTSDTVEEQSKRAASTARAMSDLAQHAQSIQEAFESLSQASSRLRESASALDREVRHFNVK